MTTTQVRYWEMKEGRRHNIVTERLDASRIRENVRHNVVQERQAWRGLKVDTFRALETKRHNKVSEVLSATDIAEKIRHNKSTESLTASEIAETQRHNQASEYETYRSNLARETETRRSNMARETETQRHNKQMEHIDKGKLVNEILRTEIAKNRAQVQNAVDKSLAAAKIKLSQSQTAANTFDLAHNIANSISEYLGVGPGGLNNLTKIINAIL